jgi:hypothetical protein
VELKDSDIVLIQTTITTIDAGDLSQATLFISGLILNPRALCLFPVG